MHAPFHLGDMKSGTIIVETRVQSSVGWTMTFKAHHSPGKMVQSRCHPRYSRKKDCSGLDVHLEEKRVPAQGLEELNLAVGLEVEVIWAGVWRQPLQMLYH